MAFMMKRSGAWVEASKVYKKISGAWVEQTDFASVVPGNVRYQDGGEYVPPHKTITVTGSGDTKFSGQTHSVAYLKINGETISSAGTYQVEPGTVVDFRAASIYYAYGTGTITLNRKSVGVSDSRNSVSYQRTVNENLTVKLSVTGGGGDGISSVGHVDITTE